jgi:hypothetical protein
MGVGIQKNADIVSKIGIRKQKSRLAPAFLFAAIQAEPVRDHAAGLVLPFGFGLFFVLAMVKTP